MGSEQGGEAASLVWAVPFAGLLLSIALAPMLVPHLWERRFPLVAAFWALLFLIPSGIVHGLAPTALATGGAAIHEYLPFILLLLALFVVAGGIAVTGRVAGTPPANTAMLAAGTLLASLLGTTGAAMLLIRPLIRANAGRRRKTHVFVFFIFLVGNIGGALTPLGDPPLFLGFLRGVSFGWTFRAMAAPMALAAGLLLALFFVLDAWFWRRDGGEDRAGAPERPGLLGAHNIGFLLAIVAVVLMSGVWHSGIMVPLGPGLGIALENLARDAALLAIALLSYSTTAHGVRIENAFAWTPFREVAILFAGLFVTIVPVLHALERGRAGPFAPLLDLVTGPGGAPIDARYFWLAGGLSSVLDNAPTYLVFFDLAGGDPGHLMGPASRTLLAISAGAVFMGALTYLGNAPNFMIKAVCEERGIVMPGFFAYLLWSGPILLPLFGLVTLVVFG